VLNMTLLFGALGLAVDVGWGFFVKQEAQAAADAAAMAAAAYVSFGGTVTCGSGGATCGTLNCNGVTTATDDLSDGCLYAAKNGFATGVTMLGGTTSPGVTGNSPTYWTQAIVTTSHLNLFGPFTGLRHFTVTASAKAGVTSYTAGACIYVLDPSSSGAFTATGSSNTTATCGIFVHSTSTSGFTTTGSARVTASQILINSTAASIGGSTSVIPTPTYNAGSPATSDPIAGVQTIPTFSNPNPCSTAAHNIGSTTVTTLNPGTYCGGITIGNSAQVTFAAGDYLINDGLSIGGASKVTFGAGLYIINGSASGVALSFGNSTIVNGAGVTFFITGQYTGHTIGNVQSTGATTVNLAAPLSGPYQGMLFLQDPALNYTSTNSFANSAASVLQGTLYFPSTAVSYSGASSTGTYTAMIAKTLSFTGSAAFKNDPTGTFTGLETKVRGLIQ
jgi:hypothetical protein